MEDLHDDDVELLTGKNFAHVAVIDRTGRRTSPSPGSTPRTEHVLVNTAVGRVKDRYVAP